MSLVSRLIQTYSNKNSIFYSILIREMCNWHDFYTYKLYTNQEFDEMLVGAKPELNVIKNIENFWIQLGNVIKNNENFWIQLGNVIKNIENFWIQLGDMNLCWLTMISKYNSYTQMKQSWKCIRRMRAGILGSNWVALRMVSLITVSALGHVCL